jgi:lipoprotein-anchoring transpeptidase ErfK/SrfK
MSKLKSYVPAMICACAIVALSGGRALAFHPFDETYGYQMPDRFKPKAARQGPAASAEPKAAAQRKAKPSRQASLEAQDEPEQKPASRRASADADSERAPPLLEGGPRPAISPTAPPVVAFAGGYGAGTIIIDTSARTLYYTLSSTTAYKYPISVGREGFTWTGTENISRVVAWPDWRPPAEMKERKPELPDVMTGGIRNPLGAKALYLGNSLYRIHGTNDVTSIGQAASSGCFRMTNGHVTHLANVAGVGTTVRVMNRLPTAVASGGKASSKRG